MSKYSILWVGQSDPWSPWCLSGISRLICMELLRRGLLFGAIGLDAKSTAFLKGTPRWAGYLRSVGSKIGLMRNDVKCDSEKHGVLSKVLGKCPDGTVVIYALPTPEVDSSLPIRRYRWMDLSPVDASELGVFGHAGKTKEQIQSKLETQRRFLSACDGVVSLSTTAADHIARDLDYPRSLITPIGAGEALGFSPKPSFDIERYSRGRVLFIGRDWHRKRGPMLVEAMQIVRRILPDAMVTVLGPPEPPKNVQGIDYMRPLDKTNPQDRIKIEELYNSSSVFCMPSLCEPWGLVYVEAQMAGLPIAGFRNWAMPDIVSDGETGMLTDDESPQGLGKILLDLLSQPARLQSMGCAAVKRVQDILSWDKVVDRLLYRVAPEALGDRLPKWMQLKEGALQREMLVSSLLKE